MLAVRTVHSSDQRRAFVIFDISIGDLLPAVSLRCRMCALWVWGGDSDFLSPIQQNLLHCFHSPL